MHGYIHTILKWEYLHLFGWAEQRTEPHLLSIRPTICVQEQKIQIYILLKEVYLLRLV